MAIEVDPEVGKNFLEHFGRRGMKWGVRNDRTDYGHGKSKGGKKDDDSKPKTVVGKTKTHGKAASEMSDAQLKRVNNRLNMEQQYAKLTAPPPTATHKVLSAVSSFGTQAVRNVAMTQVTSFANAQASKKVATLLGKKSAADVAKNMAKLGAKTTSFG